MSRMSANSSANLAVVGLLGNSLESLITDKLKVKENANMTYRERVSGCGSFLQYSWPTFKIANNPKSIN